MKKLLLAAATMLAFASAAEATTYNTHVTATTYRGSHQDGLITRAWVLKNSGPQAFTGASYSFDLSSVGDSVSMNLYSLVAFDAPIAADDLLPRPSTATFDFGAGIGAVTVLGNTFAVGKGTLGYAVAQFADTIIRVSSTLGIKISLADTIFGTDGNGNFVTGGSGKSAVSATFTLAAVPLPAALPLSLLALGAIGAAGRRRKSALAA
jgi:hypothetical protein